MPQHGPDQHQLLGERTSTTTHMALSVAVFMMATPSLNPLLLTCEATGVPPLVLSTAALGFALHIMWSDFSGIVYYSVRVFLHSILSIFFRSIEVVGTENIPTKGPVIFTGNHSNQFVDGMQVLCHGRHKVGFLIAEKSYNQAVVGTIAKMLGCMPVKRPQDSKRKGTGRLLLSSSASSSSSGSSSGGGDPCVVKGVGTSFTSDVAPGDQIRPSGAPRGYKVVAVRSDAELVLAEPPSAGEHVNSRVGGSADAGKEEAAAAGAEGSGEGRGKGGAEGGGVEFHVLQRVDQAGMFDKVLESLARGNCLGIFPEGGSTDLSWFQPGELLTLKPGVAIIAMEALHQHKLSVPIVPVGLSYFEGDRFRGRCVIEFGAPIVPGPELREEYAAEKAADPSGRAVATTKKLLKMVEEGMRGCLVGAPSYEELELIHMIRRLFSRDQRLSATQKQDLNRRFAIWYKTFYVTKAAEGAIPGDIERMNQDIKRYRDDLELLGLRDYQIRHLETASFGKLVGTIFHLVVILLVASVPMILLNLPVGLVARMVAEKHKKEALAGSTVKIEARDVRLSKMISVSIVLVPLLWVSYAVLLLFLGFSVIETALYLFWCPFFSYIAVIATEAGMVDLKDLRPHVLRLFVSGSAQKKMVDQRRALQKKVRELVRKYGPELGDLYTRKLG